MKNNIVNKISLKNIIFQFYEIAKLKINTKLTSTFLVCNKSSTISLLFFSIARNSAVL